MLELGFFMKVLAQRWYEEIEKRKEVKCPHKDCDGLLSKIEINGARFEQFTEEYWENTNYFRCNKCKDVWKYFVSASSKRLINSL